MNFFDILRHYAATQPNALASRSNNRAINYRRLWSRIERATARLQAEWHIEPGVTVAYWGQGVPDALILYLALARCGAKLLPLENIASQQAAAILGRMPAVLLLHDDAAPPDFLPSLPVRTLSSLLATRCHHTPLALEDMYRPSLIVLDEPKNGDGAGREQSLYQLTADLPASPYHVCRIAGALFDADVFAPQVLPVLAGGGTLIFD